ncbi:beta-ketoacyl-[acyl-carrier-protein] synthase family protein [Actinomadura rugatobispora]|uniref:Beta-ketoacyl-[acyl-carrier-protein] synthase family protein n=1 Tax=Actinomadura rugatobispora TaxID=1994 RepID=A0ABW1A8U7_9ACTN|nr:beta-ketoacyl-[acyl-carrier-protein] synthase family protein [Actinomadura rugatobispora]
MSTAQRVSHPVVVTGMGVKSPAGNTVADAYETVLSGKPQAVHLPELLDSGLSVAIGCPVPELGADRYFSKAERRRLDRASQLGIAAAVDAVTDAGPDFAGDAARSGVYVGSGGLSLATAVLLAGERPPVYTIPMIMPSATAAHISIRYGLRGPALTFAAACASGAVAIGEAVRAIRAGHLDRAVAGGVDALLTPFFVHAFDRLGALSRRTATPAEASRPFDAERDGFVMGEGAAFLTLERADVAERRGARVHGEITGYALTSDAADIVSPRPDGALVARAMTDALADAGLGPADIGHVNAHGSAAPAGDRAEAAALRAVFDGAGPPITALKGVTGYLLGAGGAFEAVMALLSARDGLAPPVANFTGGADAEGLDIVAGAPRALPVAPALSCSIGFGGHNAALVLSPRLG